MRIIDEFTELALFIVATRHVTACCDQKDDKFLDLALAANAACIVTGDKDLLELHPFQGIPILKPSVFLRSF